MSAPKRARDDEPAGAAAEGAGGPPPVPPPPPPQPPAEDDDAYERRLKLTDVIGFVALNGYAREASRCAGLNRETWRCIPAGLSASDADRVRRDHPLWQAVIDLRHSDIKRTRLVWAASNGHLARVRELCDWRADIEAADKDGCTPLSWASVLGHLDIVRELLARGANVNAVSISNNGFTPLMWSSSWGRVEVVRVLLAAGADKRHVVNNGETAASVAGRYSAPAARAAILALLAAAP